MELEINYAKDGVISVMEKLRLHGIYGNQHALIDKLHNCKSAHVDEWSDWWSDWFRDAGVPLDQVPRYVNEIDVLAAKSCGVKLYHVEYNEDTEQEEIIYDVYSKEAALLKSFEFINAAQALTKLFDFCVSNGFIDTETVDKDGCGMATLGIQLQQFKSTNCNQTMVEVNIRDENTPCTLMSMRV